MTPNGYATLVEMVRLSNLLLLFVFIIVLFSYFCLSIQLMRFGSLEGGYNVDVLAECVSACI